MGPIGLPEMMALFVIALLLFGPKKLPELGRTLGKGLSEFRRAKSELKATLESHMQEIERETRVDMPSLTDSHYTYPYEDYNRYNSDSPAAPDESSAQRELTGEQQAAIEANTAAADPEAHGVPALAESESSHAVSGTVPRTNGVKPLSSENPVDGTQHGHSSEPIEEHRA